MKRRTALVLAVLLLAQAVCIQAFAAGKAVYFTAVNDNVLVMSDDTMPFWSGGYL